MQEGSVTTGGTTYQLQPPFFVLATQNPIEQEGTYPLPEAQLDRFMFKLNVPFLNRDELNDVVSRTILKQGTELQKILNADRILSLRRILDRVVVADPIRDYAVRLVLATHPDSEFGTERVRRFVKWGASPRATQALIRAARVRALADGRAHVAFSDVQHFSQEVLGHRVLLNYDGQAESLKVHDLIREILEQIKETA
jgi:MoxR-like ATPase